ncbi:MAG TPA: VTT domain-containing protein [Limnochordia bacterium]
MSDAAAALEWLRSLGPWTALASFLILIVEVVIAPIPIGVAVVIANGHLFGMWEGFALSWGANLCGSLLTFGLARRWARPFVLRRLRPEHAAVIERLGARHGFRWLCLARLFPLTPADLLGYLAGLSGMSALSFAAATGLATIPALLFYAALGAGAEAWAQRARSTGWTAAIVLGCLVVLLTIKEIAARRWRRSGR